MTLTLPATTGCRNRLAYTLAEVLVAVFVVAIIGLALYAGFAAGFSAVQLAREDLRATQIMLQRLEGIRLYSWSQVLTNSYLIPNSAAVYDPLGQTNQTGGAVYTVKVNRDPLTTLPPAYQNNMRAITVSIYWTNYNGNKQIVRSRQIQTYVARYGMQNYIYGPLQ